MSISDPEVKVREGTISSSPPGEKASPYRTITDRELTLVQICCDFVCACIALPLSLVLSLAALRRAGERPRPVC